jgi:hypothetical protein
VKRWQKIAATLWTSLLAAPIVWFLYFYAVEPCGEIDPCPTGGSLPYAGVAAALLAVIALLHAAFLAMIWKAPRRPETSEGDAS